MPVDFEQVSLGQLAIFEMGQSPSSAFVSDKEGDGIPFLQGNAEFGPIYPTPTNYCFNPKKLCEPGDALISVRAPVGALNKADQTYVIGRGLAAVRFTNVHPEFGWHMLNYWARNLHQVEQGSTFKAISKGDLDTLPVLVPPLPEQRRIADILDAADAAIRETEWVIAKLRQVKRGLLHDLLTRGLDESGRLRDPDAHPERFKDSPLGRIPREWEIVSLESITEKIADRDHTTPTYTDQGVIMISPVNFFGDDGIDFSACKKITPSAHRINCRKTDVRAGDIILHRIGAGLGRVRFVTEEMPDFSILHSLALVRPNKSIVLSKYLLWAFRSYAVEYQVGLGIQSIGVPDLGLEKIGKLLFIVPSLEEQSRIVSALDSNATRIRAEEAVLAKRRQLKRGLMDDLLTGRVRV